MDSCRSPHADAPSCTADSGAAMALSVTNPRDRPRQHRIAAAAGGRTSPSTIARRMLGTPGNTKTLPIRKPGELLTGLSISAEPSGTSAIFSRA